jgi:hypothetical protein
MYQNIKMLKCFLMGTAITAAAFLIPGQSFRIKDVLALALAASVFLLLLDMFLSKRESFEDAPTENDTNNSEKSENAAGNGVEKSPSGNVVENTLSAINQMKENVTDTVKNLVSSDEDARSEIPSVSNEEKEVLIPDVKITGCPDSPGEIGAAYYEKYGPYLLRNKENLSPQQKLEFVHKFMKLHLLIHQQVAEKSDHGKLIRDWNDTQFIAKQLKLCPEQQNEFPAFFRSFL